MKYIILLVVTFVLMVSHLEAQVVATDPSPANVESLTAVYFYADKGSQGLKDYTGDIYAHTGVITNKSSNGSDWKYVPAGWGENIAKCKMQRVDNNTYLLQLTPDIIKFYGVPEGEKILQLAFVFRNEDGSKTGKDTGDKDIFVNVVDQRLSISFTSPSTTESIAQIGAKMNFIAVASAGGLLQAKVNDKVVYTTGGSTLNFDYTFSELGTYNVEAFITAGGKTVSNKVMVNVVSEVEEMPVPSGMHDGINYHENNTSVTLVLYAPNKQVVFYLGEQNDFTMQDTYKLKKDGARWWIALDNLESGKEYAYQYLVDGQLRIADPYAEKVLDPWNDPYIPASVYPALKPYPTGKTEGIVSVFQPGKSVYNWRVSNFEMPRTENLVIYELLIRDFVEAHSIKAVQEKLMYLKQLGVNAIELMPFNEFEGNSSWGYNPSFYFATDKYYGTATDYKRFIDAAHEMGMAVIMDMVLNHSYGQSPLVQLYFDKNAGDWGQPTAENPWYNQTSPNTSYSWGYDFNHEAPATKDFVDKVINYWIKEFKVDGYRFDFTKGFTNTPGDGGAYDAARIKILKRIYDVQMQANPKSLMICEHFADNVEEIELSNYGMLIWGNLNYAYSEASMGYPKTSDISWASYKQRGWSKPNLVTYSESHDEERMMYRNLNFGASSYPYDVTSMQTALDRAKLSSLFLFAIPGPKMIWQFQELGYDYSINHCPDGTMSDGCRVSEKPVKWDYASEADRKKVYNTFSQLAEIKHTYPIFSTSNFTIDVGAKADKYVYLTLGDEQAVAVGNFDLRAKSMRIDFKKTGWWHRFFANDSIQVTTEGIQFVNFAAGAYELYSTQKLTSNNWALSANKMENETSSVQIYPNPASSKVYIQSKLGLDRVEVYNQLGEIVWMSEKPSSKVAFDVSTFASGMYVVRCVEKGNVSSSKLIISYK